MNRAKIHKFLQGYHKEDKFPKSDQNKGLPLPDAEKKIGSSQLITLPEPFEAKIKKGLVTKCILDRVSTRLFDDLPISIKDLSYLLWATQGIKKKAHDKRHAHHAIKRTVPSAGSRHPFETYIIVQNVSGLKKGIYRYVASNNSLAIIKNGSVSKTSISEAVCRQIFCAKAPVLFVWTAIPYRTEWRYGTKSSMKSILIDAGHVGQNLHIACEALGFGTCMIGAYWQEAMDKILKVDGKEEFTIYLAPVGKQKCV